MSSSASPASSGSAPRRTSGRAVNPLAVEGQIEGGTAQGLGLALMEELQTRDGRITNASFTDYLIPTTLDMPPVESVLIEVPEPDAPYGVKGVGEPPTVVSTAAVVAALRDATGRPLDGRPVAPDEIVGPPLILSHSENGSTTRAGFVPDHERDRQEHDGGTSGDLPRDTLAEEDDAEQDRHDRVHVRVGGDGPDRDVARATTRTPCSPRASRTG